MTVRPAPAEHLAWLCERAHVAPSPGLRAIEVLDRDGRIAGMVGYDGWTPGACTVHVALDHPSALRPLLEPAFAIPFLELGRPVIVAMVLSTNQRSLRLVKRLGFRQVARGRDWWAPGVDLIWFEMRREECRFLPREVR